MYELAVLLAATEAGAPDSDALICTAPSGTRAGHMLQGGAPGAVLCGVAMEYAALHVPDRRALPECKTRTAPRIRPGAKSVRRA